MDESVPIPFAPTWAGQTTLHPLAFVAIVVLGIAMLVTPRRFAIVPMILAACFLPIAQRVIIVGLNINVLRIMIAIGWSRLLLRGEVRGLRWNAADTIIILWVVSGTVAYSILWGTTSAFVGRSGVALDALGMYFMFRCFIRDWQDVRASIRAFAVVSIPVALAFVVEYVTGRNFFSVFGGIPEITMVRDGQMRCQGAFSHPILAGCFWASLLPLFAAQWWAGRRDRMWAVIGVCAAGVLVLCSGSSTPVVAVACGLLAVCFFPLRRYMRPIRYGVVLLLLGLHLAMRAPVWHLIARIDVLSGNTGWHRFHLIDQAINRFDEWCLVGTRSTVHWDEFGFLWDVTNQYVFEGVNGGILTLACFVALIAVAFRSVGRIWRAAGAKTHDTVMAWALGVSLFVHCVNFLSVTYFGQTILIVYYLLAVLTALDAPARPVAARGVLRRAAVDGRAAVRRGRVVRVAVRHDAAVPGGSERRP